MGRCNQGCHLGVLEGVSSIDLISDCEMVLIQVEVGKR
jgi:hypothetical protein